MSTPSLPTHTPHLERGFDVLSPLPSSSNPTWFQFIDTLRKRYKSDKHVFFGETGVFFLFGDVPVLPFEAGQFRRFAGPTSSGGGGGKKGKKWEGYMEEVEGLAVGCLGGLVERWDQGKGRNPTRGAAWGTDVYVGWGEVLPKEVVERVEKNNKKA